jgi:hypothetical protein
VTVTGASAFRPGSVPPASAATPPAAPTFTPASSSKHCGTCWYYSFWSTYFSASYHEFRGGEAHELGHPEGGAAHEHSGGPQVSDSFEPTGLVGLGSAPSARRGVDESGWTNMGSFDCHAFNACHTDEQAGYCDGSHWACGVGAELQSKFAAAVSAPSEAKLVSLAAVLPARVRSVPERRILQVLDCTGDVIAQVEASTESLNLVAKAMARRAS